LLFDIGYAIEEAILGGRTADNGRNALVPARSTWNTLRERRDQVHDPRIADRALQLLPSAKEWELCWCCEMKRDEAWGMWGLCFSCSRLRMGLNALRKESKQA
jgi:hypothetical protein